MALVARAFWGVRPEARAAGTAKVVHLLDELRLMEPETYSHWYLKARSRAKALEGEVQASPEGVDAAISVNREDLDERHVIVALGFSLSLWNGLPADEALTLNCQFGVTSPHVKNSVILGMPSGYQDDVGKARAVLDLIVEWEPDEATVWSENRDEIMRA